MLSKMKLAVAQIATDAGDIKGNTQKIIKYLEKARRDGASIVVFPELAIPGYMSLDLILNTQFVNENLDALDKIIKRTKDIFLVIGFIDQDRCKTDAEGRPLRYNSAAIVYNQQLLAIQDKTLLPDYDVFFENRYFSSGRNRSIIDHFGLKIGVEICEDLWDENYPIKVSADLVSKGANLLINISGSPFYVNKRLDRERLIRRVISNFKIPFIYVNTVGVQDGYDGELVFDGESMVFDGTGKLISLGNKFEEDLFYVDLDELLKNENKQCQLSNSSFDNDLFRALTLAIKSYFGSSHFNKAFIGLSGGIDSAVVTALATEALGKKNVTGICMPSQFSSKETIEDSLQLAKNLGIKLEIIQIDTLFNEFLKVLKPNFVSLDFDVTEENLQARIRGILLMAHANKFKGLVISTANKTEMALGYSTLYGDMCGAISPLADVDKLRVYQLAHYINENYNSIIPKRILKKAPTAELRRDQTDEKSLGASYDLIVPLVNSIVEDIKSKDELVKEYPKDLVEKIIDLINVNEYKRRQSAPAIKVTKKAFGIGRRIPIVHNFKD